MNDTLVHGLMTSHNLDLAPAALTPWHRWLRLRILGVSSLPERHTPYRRRPAARRRRLLLYVDLVVINHSVVIGQVSRTVRTLLKVSAQSLLGLRHRRYRREFLQQRVPPERALDRQRRVSRLDATVLPLQHLYLLVQKILGQFVSPENSR